MGNITFGPYGGTGGASGELNCPEGHYISSIYGRSCASVDRLGIRCRIWDDVNGSGVILGEFGGDGGKEFDELGYSYGYRPTRITILSHFEVYAIQVTYSNIPVDNFTSKSTVYREEWSPKHGGDGGYMNQFICPNQGVITGIKYRSAAHLDSIQFKCTSALGDTSFGPYGRNDGDEPVEENCPKGFYIGSIHGRSEATVYALGIRCVKVGQSNSGGLKCDAHGGSDGEAFDDENYQYKQLRPVNIEVWSSAEVYSIRIKYGNMPIAINCRVTHIEVIDKNIVALADGYEVIGITTGSSCSTSDQLLKLDYSQTISETIGIETTEGSEINWEKELWFSFSSQFVTSGSYSPDITVGLTQLSGGSNSWYSATVKQTTTEFQKSHGTEVTYKAPGAATLVGYVTRYRINQNNVPVLYYSTCDGGSIPPKSGTIKLTSKVHGKTDFLDYQFVFNSTDTCTAKVRNCIRSISGTVTDPQTLETSFRRCFPAGSGTFF